MLLVLIPLVLAPQKNPVPQLPLGPPRSEAYELNGATQLNPPGTSYIDPELHPFLPELVFQQGSVVWTGAIDPTTGLFVEPGGTDRFVDLASSLLSTRNGPEYGWDAAGVAIFYNKSVLGGPERIWRATPSGATYQVEPLSPPGLDRVNQLPSQWSDAPTTWLLYAREDAAQPPGVIALADEATPTVEQDITRVLPGFAGFRWQRGSSIFTATESEGPFAGQVLLGDAATGEVRVVTDDPGVKFDPYSWRAPEYGGATAFAAIVDESDLAIYVDLGGPFFERVSLLELPKGTRMRYLQSPEPFLAGGRSFITLSIADDPGSFFEDVGESEIWVYGIGDGPNRFARRFDDGLPGRVRHEAEAFAGTDEILLYYNRRQHASPLGVAGFDLIRVRTGMQP